MKLIAFLRRRLFHTAIGRSEFAARVYRIVFSAAAPDLTRPVAFRGCMFYLDPADRTLSPGVVGGFYEQRESEVFERLVQHADVFFDVGANIGLYSVLGCARQPRLEVRAFEAVSENRDILRRNLELNGCSGRVSIEPEAVSDETGTAILSLASSGTHSLSRGDGGPTREVTTMTLDDFLQSGSARPDLLKIDVEGHESAVLKGAEILLSQAAPTVLMEFSPRQHDDLDALLDRLSMAFESCFMVDEISGAIVEMPIRLLNRERDCNIVLASQPQHLAVLRELAER